VDFARRPKFTKLNEQDFSAFLESDHRLRWRMKLEHVVSTFEFPDQGLRRLSWIDAHLFHPGEQGSPLKSQAGRGTLRTADASLGLL
jgi:hypothetical protein